MNSRSEVSARDFRQNRAGGNQFIVFSGVNCRAGPRGIRKAESRRTISHFAIVRRLESAERFVGTFPPVGPPPKLTLGDASDKISRFYDTSRVIPVFRATVGAKIKKRWSSLHCCRRNLNFARFQAFHAGINDGLCFTDPSRSRLDDGTLKLVTTASRLNYFR